MSTLTVTDGRNALIFAVERGATLPEGRIAWHYRITDGDDKIISEGSDLQTPAFRSTPDDALTSLLGFVGADADSYQWSLWNRREPADGYLFGLKAAETFYQLSDEISMTAFERED